MIAESLLADLYSDNNTNTCAKAYKKEPRIDVLGRKNRELKSGYKKKRLETLYCSDLEYALRNTMFLCRAIKCIVK